MDINDLKNLSLGNEAAKIIQAVLEQNKLLEQQNAVLKEENEKYASAMEQINSKQSMYDKHLSLIYKSKTIEETLECMADLGKLELEVADCDVYFVNTVENTVFTVDDIGDRRFIENDDMSSYINKAISTKEPIINNEYYGEAVGDNKTVRGVQNTAVVPLISKSNDVIGVVVAKNKPDGFSLEDAKKFDLSNGKIGTAFALGLETKIYELEATTDKLTTLKNRTAAEKELKSDVRETIENGGDVSVVMLDIDHFKKFNDTYGHDVGDRVLKQVADVLKNNIRSTDEVFRWGGEEMVIISKMNESRAYVLADRLRQIISETPLDIGDKTVQITVSMGVAPIDSQKFISTPNDKIFQSFESNYLKLADDRLYNAKEGGRNQVVASDKAMSEAMREDYEVQYLTIADDFEGITTPLLLEDGKEVAHIETLHEGGYTVETTARVVGEACVRYCDEIYDTPSLFPSDLVDTLRYGDISSIEVVEPSHIVSECKVYNSDFEVVATMNMQWENEDLSTYSRDTLRTSLIGDNKEFLKDAVEKINEKADISKKRTTVEIASD